MPREVEQYDGDVVGQCDDSVVVAQMRRYRSLPELLDEAEAVFSHRASLVDIHPEHPKPPTPPKMRYVWKKMSKYRKKHPDVTIGQIVKILSKKYETLPDEKKDKYVQKHLLECGEYSRKKLTFCQENHLPLPRSALDNGGEGCSRDEGPPEKPPPHGRALFLKELSKADRAAFGNRLLKVMSERWKEMSENEKQKYKRRCEKMKREYNAKLIKYLDRFNEEEKQRFMAANKIKLSKKPLDRYMRRPGEPTMPARSGFIYFFKEQSEHLSKNIPHKERMGMARKLWYALSAKEKRRYGKIIQENLEKYREDLQNWFQTLTPKEKGDYLKRKPSMEVYLKTSTHVKRSLKQPSEEEGEYEEDDDEVHY
ncbi:nucleolar transcription factor 1 isoform X2 [Fundulus heteroclitus]|uniref:nucleolar transcription factor 1 isoform X2 n=1 Tax=Fundulus heteroclitus TaxID=8078 RepID=UPI00165B2E1F|nr:nucleolar transcription factor 1 isoform X2 [Fundulus heteroclitus]